MYIYTHTIKKMHTIISSASLPVLYRAFFSTTGYRTTWQKFFPRNSLLRFTYKRQSFNTTWTDQKGSAHSRRDYSGASLDQSPMGWELVAVLERWLLYRDGNVWNELCHLKLELVGCIKWGDCLTEWPLYWGSTVFFTVQNNYEWRYGVCHMNNTV